MLVSPVITGAHRTKLYLDIRDSSPIQEFLILWLVLVKLSGFEEDLLKLESGDVGEKWGGAYGPNGEKYNQ